MTKTSGPSAAGLWHRVLREESYPPSAALKEDAFDEDTVRTAADAVFALVKLVQPHVDDR